jgi:CHAT domain-containing protein
MFRKPARALLVGDPTGELPGARREIQRLAQLYQAPTILMGHVATVDSVTSMLGGPVDYDVVHFAGHAWYDTQDVYLTLAGGSHLTDDLIRAGLSHRPPCVLFLNSHYTAFVPPGVSAKGAEPMKATTMGRMGFTEVAMRAGVGAFVGCFGSPTDGGAEAIAVAFHQALLSGVSAAQALYLARTQAQLPPDDATPLLYALSGYGDLTLE